MVYLVEEHPRHSAHPRDRSYEQVLNENTTDDTSCIKLKRRHLKVLVLPVLSQGTFKYRIQNFDKQRWGVIFGTMHQISFYNVIIIIIII